MGDYLRTLLMRRDGRHRAADRFFGRGSGGLRIFSLITAVFLLNSCALFENEAGFEHVAWAEKISDKYSQTVWNSDQMELYGQGGELMGEVNSIMLAYAIDERPMLLPEVRELFVRKVDQLVQMVNDFREIRPYLRDYPFTYKNTKLSISFTDRYRKPYPAPYIDRVVILGGEICYYVETQSQPPPRFPKYTETYEEAKEAIGRGQLEI